MSSEQSPILIEEWQRAKLGALEFIEAMPDDKLGYRPVPDVLSFAGQFLHIAEANYLFAKGAFGVTNPFEGQKLTELPALQLKPALIDCVRAAYDFIIDGIQGLAPAAFDEAVPFFKWTMPRYLILSKALEHHAHHRGQTVVYFRLQGLKPPSEHLF